MGRLICALCHPADGARLDAERAAAFAQHAPRAVYKLRICRSDTGAVRQIEVRVRIHYDASGRPLRSNAAVIDVTEQRTAEVALQTSEACLRAVFDGTATFIGLLATDGTLLKANRSSLEFFGVPAESVIGRPAWETPWFLNSSTAPSLAREDIARAAHGELIRRDVDYNGVGGQIRSCEFSLCPIRDTSGNVTFLLGEARDVTERMRAERALAENVDSLRRTQQAETLAELLNTLG